MNELKSSPVPEANNQSNTTPPPLSRCGAFAAIAAFVQFAQTTNSMVVSYDQMLTNFSKQLTKIGQEMNTDLQNASDQLATDAKNGADSSTIASDNDKYQNVEIKYQNMMTPYNTQTDSWTDGVKQLSSDQANFFQYCQGPLQIFSNLSNKL